MWNMSALEPKMSMIIACIQVNQCTVETNEGLSELKWLFIGLPSVFVLLSLHNHMLSGLTQPALST